MPREGLDCSLFLFVVLVVCCLLFVVVLVGSVLPKRWEVQTRCQKNGGAAPLALGTLFGHKWLGLQGSHRSICSNCMW